MYCNFPCRKFPFKIYHSKYTFSTNVHIHTYTHVSLLIYSRFDDNFFYKVALLWEFMEGISVSNEPFEPFDPIIPVQMNLLQMKPTQEYTVMRIAWATKGLNVRVLGLATFQNFRVTAVTEFRVIGFIRDLFIFDSLSTGGPLAASPLYTFHLSADLDYLLLPNRDNDFDKLCKV